MANSFACDPNALPFKDLPTGATFWKLTDAGYPQTRRLYTKVERWCCGGLWVNADYAGDNSHVLVDIDPWCLIVPARLPSPTHESEAV